MPNGGSDTTTDVARQEAAGVARSASDVAQQVGSTAKEQATAVASDVKEQGQRLAGEARQQVNEQATTQRDRTAKSLRSVGKELQSMADSSEQSGMGTQLVRQVGSTAHQVASYLEEREPSQLLDDLRAFARRRPGTFLLAAALAGVVAGRLTRGIKSANASSGQGQSAQPSATDHPAQPMSTGYTAQPAVTEQPAQPAVTGDLPPLGNDPGYRPAAAEPVAEPLVAPAPMGEPDGSGTGSYPTQEYDSDWSAPATPARTDPGPDRVTP